MAREIERKFLVPDTAFLRGLSGTRCRQGYIRTHNGTAVRLRVIGARAFITLKGRAEGISRAEYEYPVPLADAEAHHVVGVFAQEAIVRQLGELETSVGQFPASHGDVTAGVPVGHVLPASEADHGILGERTKVDGP